MLNGTSLWGSGEGSRGGDSIFGDTCQDSPPKKERKNLQRGGKGRAKNNDAAEFFFPQSESKVRKRFFVLLDAAALPGQQFQFTCVQVVGVSKENGFSSPSSSPPIQQQRGKPLACPELFVERKKKSFFFCGGNGSEDFFSKVDTSDGKVVFSNSSTFPTSYSPGFFAQNIFFGAPS